MVVIIILTTLFDFVDLTLQNKIEGLKINYKQHLARTTMHKFM